MNLKGVLEMFNFFFRRESFLFDARFGFEKVTAMITKYTHIDNINLARIFLTVSFLAGLSRRLVGDTSSSTLALFVGTVGLLFYTEEARLVRSSGEALHPMRLSVYYMFFRYMWVALFLSGVAAYCLGPFTLLRTSLLIYLASCVLVVYVSVCRHIPLNERYRWWSRGSSKRPT